MIETVNSSMKHKPHVALQRITLTHAPDDHPQHKQTIEPGERIENLSYLPDKTYSLMRVKRLYEPIAKTSDAADTSKDTKAKKTSRRKKTSG